MKGSMTKLVCAVILALLILGGVTWVLAWRKPATALAEVSAPGVAQGLPSPYLNHREVVDAPFDNPPFPTIDGAIAPGEYAGADKVTFPGHGVCYDQVEVYFVEDGLYLYIAFDLPLYDLSSGSSYVDVYLDLDHDHIMGSNDYQLRVRDDGVAREYTPTVSGLWGGETSPIGWTAAMTTSLVNGGWQVEYRIEYAKLGITAGTFKEIGLALGTVDQEIHFWPPDAYSTDLTLWGSLVSSSDWGVSPITGGPFYWKPGPWEDYAISGMPDFDQRQDGWYTPTSPISTHCGPVAMANSLWWFDSKFETLTGTAPSIVSDSYRLVTSYNPGVWDDHDPQNVIPFVDDLANNYFGTNQGVQGTNVISMFYGTHRYLRDHGLWDEYIITLVEKPDFDWVADEVMRSEDVILLMGFYQEVAPFTYIRVGGHYVSVAGVDPIGRMIAFSDPYIDAVEAGLVPGRMLSGTLILPHLGGHGSSIHNDAGNVSHDIYPVIPTDSPGGKWGPDAATYPWFLFEPWFGKQVNPHPTIPDGPYTPGPPMWIEVEFALTVSPYTWKSSGHWEPDATDPVSGTWRYWEDYAVNGVPDFNQRQDNWIHPLSITWSYCGPVAAANSLWWFDSKFEPLPVGPPPPPPPPPLAPPLIPPPPAVPAAPLMPGAMPPADGYPLVLSYWGPAADDHDPANVESGNPFAMPPPPPPWWPLGPTGPGGGEFVDELAAYFDTDGQMSGYGLHAGTVITDMYVGIEQYIIDRQDPSIPLPPGITMRQGYVITMTHSPDFWWVAEEIEHSEDVILLLGFWQNQDSDWVRLGGHYITAVGVDKQGGLIGFSDPWYDGVEWAWPYAYPQGTPIVIGRAADGWMYLHSPYHSHAAHVHNDAGNVSHDVYRARGTDSPGGVWGPWGYLETWEGNFEAQNGGKTGTYSSTYPLPQTEVDGAIAVSPVADVWATKTATPTTLNAGDTVTFTIQFGNYGSLPAEDVVLTDTLPLGLTNVTFAGYWTSNGLTVTHRTGTTMIWDLPDLAWLEWGIITVTAQVDPSYAWTGQDTITNTVKISTSSIEQYQITELANIDDLVLTVETPDLSIVKTVAPTGTVAHGDWVTFTITYSNAGSVTAYNVVITDTIPLSLTNAYTTSVGALITSTGSTNYVWQVADLAPGTDGVITITAQVDNTWPFITSMQNDSFIAALYDPNASNNQATVVIPVYLGKVYLPLVMRDY